MADLSVSDQYLGQLFSSEESDCFERKENAESRDSIGKTICAFANNLSGSEKPGVLIIGQEDSHECANLKVDDRLEDALSDMRSNGNIMPPPVISVFRKEIKNCPVCIVVVNPANNPPVRYKGACWVRVGASTRRASEADERTLGERRRDGDLPFDSREVSPVVPFEELNKEYFENYYLPRAIDSETLRENDRDIEHQMKSLRFLSRKGNPTNAAVLCFTDEPRGYIPQSGAYVQFARFQGDQEDVTMVVNKKEIWGGLFDQMRQIDELIKINISVAADLEETRRRDYPDYPHAALREVAVNALIHRDYEHSAPVYFFWFNNRIEIRSPGGYHGGKSRTPQGGQVEPSYRNPILAEAAKYMGYAERFGMGIERARKALNENGNPDLEYVFGTTTLFTLRREQ